MAREIFVSLTEHDTPIAEALKDAFKQLFGQALDVQFSSSKSVDGGIGMGEDWFQWIVERVKACHFALILITPSSVNKPWILWEAGAVAGAALASSSGSMRKVRPMVYQVSTDLIPSPIRDSKAQYRRGDNAADFEFMLNELLTDLMAELPRDLIPEFGKKINGVITTYLEKVDRALLDAPAVMAPAVIEEWLLRLNRLRDENRPSDAEHLQDWMDLAFGRGGPGKADRPQPLDLRIHSGLADLYLKAKNPKRAIVQLELARRLAPRDIYVLRQLGKARLDAGDRDEAREVIDRIHKLDARAVLHNAECAALAGRWHREGGDYKRAEQVLSEALSADSKSYYLANLLAEVRLQDGNRAGAEDAYRQALAIIKRLGENNIWVLATAANAAFFVGDDETAVQALVDIQRQRPDGGTWATIERGLSNVADQVDNGIARRDSMLARVRN